MAQNRVVVDGRVSEIGALRLTPAGVPVIEFRVTHSSEQIEAGMPRRAEFEIPAVAMGDAAKRATTLAAGATVKLEGFLASRSRTMRQPVLHVNILETFE